MPMLKHIEAAIEALKLSQTSKRDSTNPFRYNSRWWGKTLAPHAPAHHLLSRFIVKDYLRALSAAVGNRDVSQSHPRAR